MGAPQVSYREAPTQEVQFNYRHRKQTGGAGQYAHVIGRLVPLPAESPRMYVFENEVHGGRIPTEYIPSCDKGFQSARGKGPLAGYEVVRVKIVLEDGTLSRRGLFRPGVSDLCPRRVQRGVSGEQAGAAGAVCEG